MMELQEFVKSALAQIVKGVAEAQDLVKEHDAMINPSGRVHVNTDASFIRDGFGEFVSLTSVEFDVAVTATASDQAQGGIGIVAGVFGAGVKGQTASENKPGEPDQVHGAHCLAA